jgi:hypothetical protein
MNLQEAIEFLDQQGYYLTENNRDKSAGDWYNEYNKLGGSVYDITDLYVEIFGFFPDEENTNEELKSLDDEVDYDEVVEKIGTPEEVVAEEKKQRKIKIDNLLSYIKRILPEVEDILQEKIDISNGKYDTHIEFNKEFKNNKVVKLNYIDWEHASAWVCDNIIFAIKNDDLYGIIYDDIMFHNLEDLNEYINA